MTYALMGLQPVSLELPNAMNAVDGATIVRRIRISRPDEGRGRCKASRAWDPRKDFSQPTQPHITPPTSSAISPQQERTEPSGHWRCRRGVKLSLRREPDEPGDLLDASDLACRVSRWSRPSTAWIRLMASMPRAFASMRNCAIWNSNSRLSLPQT